MKTSSRILVVEDNAIVDMDICNRLEKIGCIPVGTASSGNMAIKMVKREKPDLVLMDIVLKGDMDGIEAAEIIQSRLEIPVVFITAHADDVRFERAKLASPFGYMIKPFRNREFKITIEMALYKALIDSKRKNAEQALRKSEEKYRSMMEIMVDAICICSFDHRLEYMNPAMIRQIGYDATGEKCHKAIHDLDEQCTWCHNQEIKEGHSVEQKIISPKDKHSYHITHHPIIRDDGSISVMNVYRDVTELNKMEGQLIQAQKMEAVGRLAGGVAHDYNNVLSVIMGYTELALGSISPGDPVRGNLTEVLSATHRATTITRQLLAFARKQTIAPRVINLNSTVDSLLKMLRRLIGEDIHFEWVSGPKLWPVKMDPIQIDQILVNLCVNSRDAIINVGKIVMETRNIILDQDFCDQHIGFQPGEFVQLTVSDDGCGMEQEIQDHIFEPFFTTKDADKGTGLGLATVYGIVKQNNGFINCTSEAGTGTAFKLYFPRYLLEDDYNETKAEKKVPGGHGETILLVEDDTSLLKMTTKMLNGLNYHVITSESPERALALIDNQNSKIDLLITDIIMPGMNGKELSKKLKLLYPDITCLYMSGYTADVIAHHGVLEEGVHFLQKPFTRWEVADMVNTLITQEQ